MGQSRNIAAGHEKGFTCTTVSCTRSRRIAQAAWVHDVEEEVRRHSNYGMTKRHTQAVCRRRKKRRMHDDYNSDEHELGIKNINAENDLSVAFASV
jgi:hypothetical protein